MTINFTAPDAAEFSPRIAVFGVGGAGGNAVNNMIESGLGGIEFVVANTDAQALERSKAATRVQLGSTITQGLGAGSHPEIGRAAAEESRDELMEHLQGCNMVFIAAGMGGGTGTGAAPVIASCAREIGALTVGVVTKPFTFEGKRRMTMAESGLDELHKYVDTMICIPNQNLFAIATEQTTFADAFKMADEVLHSGVRSITDLVINPGLVNLDFADVRTVMGEMGKAMMGTGTAAGDSRAIEAAQKAINNPLLEDMSLAGAKGVLINIAGGYDIRLHEIDEAVRCIQEGVDGEANIIFGSSIDPDMEGDMRVSVIATGIEGQTAALSPRAAIGVTQPQQVPQTQPAASQTPSAPQGSTPTQAIMQQPRQMAAPAAPATQQRTPMHAAPVAPNPRIDLRDEASAVQAPNTGRSFTMPEAHRVEKPVAPATGATRPDPFAEADMLNANRAPLRDDDPIVTHQPVGRPAEHAAPQMTTPQMSPQMTASPMTPAAPVSEEKPKAGGNSLVEWITGRGRKEEAPEAAAPQGTDRVSRIDPVARPVPGQAAAGQEDDLEIPAFLRRPQAN